VGDVIAFVLGSDPVTSVGGAVSYARVHARAALRAGFEPHLFCLSRRQDTEVAEFGTVHRTATSLTLQKPRYVLSFRNKLIWIYERLHAARLEAFTARTGRAPAVIHAFNEWGGAGVRVSRRLAARGIPVAPVVSAYTPLRHEFAAKLRSVTRAHGPRIWLACALDLLAIRVLIEPFERRAYQGNRLVLVNYDSVRRLLVAMAGEGLKIRKMPYAPETAFRDDGPPPVPPEIAALEPRDAPLLVAVSRQDPRKGLDVLLRALARLRAARVRFRACLVGGGALLEPHRRLARQLGLGPETLLPGFVADPYAYLCAADVFALPSLQEASGSLSLLEALQAGAAVVASNIDGIPEDVEDGRSALLTPPGDDQALAGALGRLVQDPLLRRTLATRGRAVFDARFSAAALTSALGDLYGELIDRSRQSARPS